MNFNLSKIQIHSCTQFKQRPSEIYHEFQFTVRHQVQQVLDHSSARHLVADGVEEEEVLELQPHEMQHQTFQEAIIPRLSIEQPVDHSL